MQAKTERFEMRLDEDLLGSVDTWRSQRDDSPSRAEAIRQLVEAGLRVKSRDSVEFTDGEKMIILMLCDLMKHHKVKGDTDIDFVASAIFGGHQWGLKWELTGVFHNHVDSPQVVKEVASFLDMWSFIEHGYAELTKKEKEQIEKDAAPFGRNVMFRGFDGNNESEYVGVARFFIKNMGRFSVLEDRDLNSHMPLVDAYRRMYRLFEPMCAGLGGGNQLSAEQITTLMKAMARR
jgi:uncharacterized protein